MVIQRPLTHVSSNSFVIQIVKRTAQNRAALLSAVHPHYSVPNHDRSAEILKRPIKVGRIRGSVLHAQKRCKLGGAVPQADTTEDVYNLSFRSSRALKDYAPRVPLFSHEMLRWPCYDLEYAGLPPYSSCDVK